MMIGQYKIFGRNDFIGIIIFEMYYSIFQVDVVWIIYFINVDIQFYIIYGGCILFFQISQYLYFFVGMVGKGCESKQ